MDLLILKGHIVQTPSFGALDIAENSFLVTENGRITGVFHTLPDRYPAERVVDFGDRLIMPSFADTHLHAPQYPMLGMGMDLPLLDWLNTYTFKTEYEFRDKDFARDVYKRLAAELVANGTTRVCAFSSLHREATLILFEEFEKAGLTGYAGKVNMDRNSGDLLTETTEESERETLRWLDEVSGFKRMKPVLTPRFTPTCSDALMAFLGDLARERGLPVQSHLSENTSEIAWVRELHPDCPQYWESYAKFGLFNDRTMMAHCVYSDERERGAMQENGVWVSHCPNSNVNLISGTASVRKMINDGVKVTLGSDIAGGDQLEMYRVVTAAIRASKIKRIESDWNDDFLTVAEAFCLGTTAAAPFFGAKGGFSVGDPLHAVVVDDASLPPPAKRLSTVERFERLPYLMTKDNIAAVYADGLKIK